MPNTLVRFALRAKGVSLRVGAKSTIRESQVTPERHIDFVVDPASRVYAIWWSLDANGTVAEAVTDFGLLDPLIFSSASSKD